MPATTAMVIEAMRNNGQGFNALTGNYEDLMAAGIVDGKRSCGLPFRMLFRSLRC